MDTNTMPKTFVRRLLDRLDSWASKVFDVRLPNNSRPWRPGGVAVGVTVDNGPFNASELDEDLGSDEIRASVVVKPRPAFAELATAKRESPQVVLP